MTTVPLGRGAYERLYAGAPVVELLNRWLEANPTNLREGTSVLARPGTSIIINTLSQGDFEGFGPMRGNYALSGLFDDSLFVVCGTNLYRIGLDLTVTHIVGTLTGSGTPEVAWQAGEGYQRLWISDGALLQYYEGLTPAVGTLSLIGAVVDGTDTVRFGSVYYKWGTSFSGSDDGTAGNPFIVKQTTILGATDPLGQLILAVTATGEAGVDYSATLIVPHPTVTAVNNSGVDPATSIKISALAAGTGGNSIVFSVIAGTGTSASGSGTLASGGLHALQGCTMPDGVAPLSLTEVHSFVLVSVANTQKFYWVDPGAVFIDPLNFASKESSPDPIHSMRTVGDQVLIMGAKSTESWYATGVAETPFAPIEGRVYARGVVQGSAVVVNDGIILVGDDGRVYSIGFASADGGDTPGGVNRISNNGIEERIRYQIRREQGLTP